MISPQVMSAGTGYVDPNVYAGYTQQASEQTARGVAIYVGNLPFDTTEDEIRQMFGTYGDVARVALPLDRETQRPRGFGFVHMTDAQQADDAIKALDGTELGGRQLRINLSQGGGRGGRGGRGAQYSSHSSRSGYERGGYYSRQSSGRSYGYGDRSYKDRSGHSDRSTYGDRSGGYGDRSSGYGDRSSGYSGSYGERASSSGYNRSSDYDDRNASRYSQSSGYNYDRGAY